MFKHPGVFYTSYLRMLSLLLLSFSLILFIIIGLCVFQGRKINREIFFKGQTDERGYIKKEESQLYPRGILNAEVFKLNDQNLQIPMPNLSEEIYIVGKNDRPDATRESFRILLGLKSSGQVREFQQGDRGYLSFANENYDTLRFNDEKTPFWFIPLIESSNVKVLSTLEIEEKSHKPRKEQKEYILSTHPNYAALSEKSLEELSTAFKRFDAYGEDLFIREYGGHSYERLKESYRLIRSFEGKSKVTFVKEGDGFIYKNNEWRLCTFGAQSSHYPIAQVTHLESDRIQVRIWDVSGYRSTSFFLQVKKGSFQTISIENLVEKIRQRTLQSISCRIGNKSWILRKGDWLLRNQSGWKLISSEEDILSYINHQLEGELFVLDAIEKSKNESYLLGRFFDKMRSTMKIVKIPFADLRKKQKEIKSQDPKNDNYFEDLVDELELFDELY